MSKEARDYWRFQKKLAAIQYAHSWGNVSRACRTFGVSRAAFYRWKKIYDVEGEAGLRQRKPIAKDHPRRIPQATVDKVLELRKRYHLGPQRIVWYMERYHGIRISFSSVYRILVVMGLDGCQTRSVVARFTPVAMPSAYQVITYRWMSSSSI
jgi:transposase-like protein